MSDPDREIPELLDNLERLSTRSGTQPPSVGFSAHRGGGLEGTSIQVETVFSESESPAFHSTAQGQQDMPEARQAKATRKYKIFVAPMDYETLDTLCFGVIGQGATFCTQKACTRTHKTGRFVIKTPGQVYVAKSTSVAFNQPSVNASKLPSDLFANWKASANTIDQWNAQFLVISTLDSQVSPTQSDVDNAELFATRALSFKTPAKRTREEALADGVPIVLSPYGQQLPSQDEKSHIPALDVDTLTTIVRGLDEGLFTTNTSIRALVEEFEAHVTKQLDTTAKLNFKVDATTAQIGRKPEDMSEDFDSPNIWGTVTLMANALDAVQQKTEDYTHIEQAFVQLGESVKTVEDQQGDLDSRLQIAKAGILDALQKRKEEQDARFTSTVRALVNHITRLREDLESTNARIEGLGRNQPPVNDIDVDSLLEAALPLPKRRRNSDPCAFLDRRVATLEEQIRTGRDPSPDLTPILDRLQQLEVANDDRAVAFANLGFRNFTDACAWLEMHRPQADTSLVLDVHLVFEYLFEARSSVDTVKHMENMARIRTGTLSDRTAIASFGSRIPKLFSSAEHFGVIKSDQSFFDQIKSFEQWSFPSTGVRDKLMVDLETFSDTHGDLISQMYDPESRIFFVASQALTLSVAWVGAFVQFIDEYYKELSKAKFGSNKAWHVTTRIAKRILTDVSLPRVAAPNLFSVAQQDQTQRQIFWSIVRSHDVMAEFKSASFKNHPAVASELVKFLAVNTGFEIVERLQSQMTQVLEDVGTLQRTAASTTKAATTAANKADEAKRDVDALKKRFEQLLKKNASLST